MKKDMKPKKKPMKKDNKKEAGDSMSNVSEKRIKDYGNKMKKKK